MDFVPYNPEIYNYNYNFNTNINIEIDDNQKQKSNEKQETNKEQKSNEKITPNQGIKQEKQKRKYMKRKQSVDMNFYNESEKLDFLMNIKIHKVIDDDVNENNKRRCYENLHLKRIIIIENLPLVIDMRLTSEQIHNIFSLYTNYNVNIFKKDIRISEESFHDYLLYLQSIIESNDNICNKITYIRLIILRIIEIILHENYWSVFERLITMKIINFHNSIFDDVELLNLPFFQLNEYDSEIVHYEPVIKKYYVYDKIEPKTKLELIDGLFLLKHSIQICCRSKDMMERLKDILCKYYGNNILGYLKETIKSNFFIHL